MIKIIVENGVVKIEGSWEEVGEEIFGLPECDSVGELVDWMRGVGIGERLWREWEVTYDQKDYVRGEEHA